MPNYLVIKDNKVVNIILADSKEIAEAATNEQCIEHSNTDVTIGWNYLDSKFYKPE